MTSFVLIRGKPITISMPVEQIFEAGIPVKVTDPETIRKLRGNKSFREVPDD